MQQFHEHTLYIEFTLTMPQDCHDDESLDLGDLRTAKVVLVLAALARVALSRLYFSTFHVRTRPQCDGLENSKSKDRFFTEVLGGNSLGQLWPREGTLRLGAPSCRQTLLVCFVRTKPH